ncbi:YehR family lipoprotein [Listeria sp. FSL L7-0091]|uniref:YehR family lipoprotein n=1 Tax=Listeria farberi TaxID=2713500 RepID=A0A7X0ZIQ8_9LIST|nr:YehR family lipoprotein [Listeria farberi]MBC1376029.1 YehR family lipoprotein [Listeria farberi]MBC1381952.1 YehR family lipoprotein [Listeria farberi]MBC2262006.1 YehR family lipoprotein [Listeria farberi]MBC2268304.1 YehR family lipoprotein [Listeria farberi]MBC2288069.1 YehR family lipoprotein [Listeria farberi]
MKMLKKGTAVLFVMIMAVMLVACGDKEETKTYTISQNGVDSKLTYTYKGDKVTKQTAENTMLYTSLGVTSKEDAEKVLKATSEKFQGIEGLKESIEYKDDKAIETLEVDYTKISSEDIKKIPGMASSGDASKGISMKESEKMLKSQGFKEVEK